MEDVGEREPTVQIPRTVVALLLTPMLLLAAACGSGNSTNDAASGTPLATAAAAQPQAKTDNPVDKVALGSEPVTLTFWHVQTGANADKLQQTVTAFTAKNPNIKINLEFVGNYTETYKKLLTTISAGSGLPDISAVYPSQVAEYQGANVVVPLDDYITSEKYGLKKADLDDFIDAYLAEARFYPEYKNQYLSFPFTKSVLVMYYNEDKLKEANQKVPTTWDEFKATCKAVTKGETKCLSIGVDASTFNGLVFSRGGKQLSDDGKKWMWNEKPGVDSLTMYQEMMRDGTAIRAEKAFADQQDFGSGRAVFTMGSTSGIPFYDREVGGKFKWGVANLPHDAGVQPVTVLYGGSIAMFKSTPVKQLAAWEFMKFFSAPETTADFSAASGYMPLRKSSLTLKPVTDQIAKFPPYGVAVKEIAPTGKPESSVRGSQEQRDILAETITAALSDLSKNPKTLLDEAQKKAQQNLK